MEKLDVLIVGAGLSGLGAACHMATQCPGKRYAVLEARSFCQACTPGLGLAERTKAKVNVD